MTTLSDEELRKLCAQIINEPKLYGDAVHVARALLSRLTPDADVTEGIFLKGAFYEETLRRNPGLKETLDKLEPPPAQPETVDLPKSWRCFHCDELMTDEDEAANHFGHEEGTEPACKLSADEKGLVGLLRDAHKRLDEFYREDTASYKEFYALGAAHSTALKDEEQKGYDKGLKDGRAEASNILQPGVGVVDREVLSPRILSFIQSIASQRLEDEMEGWESQNADYAGAYDLIVKDARKIESILNASPPVVVKCPTREALISLALHDLSPNRYFETKKECQQWCAMIADKILDLLHPQAGT